MTYSCDDGSCHSDVQYWRSNSYGSTGASGSSGAVALKNVDAGADKDNLVIARTELAVQFRPLQQVPRSQTVFGSGHFESSR